MQKIILSESTSQLILPAIVLAEAAWIVERGRTSIPSVMDLLNAVETDARVSIYPVDKTVVKQSVSLTTIGEMHDRQIVATTLVLASQNEIVALLTCDRNITASGLVKIIW
jgi:PIN domain nuclease of toxin-antitoxin system